MLSPEQYLKSIGVDRYPPSVVKLNREEDPRNNSIIFQMKDLVYNVPTGKQIRYVNPEYHELKSKTAYGSKIGYFYDDTKLKKQLPIIILE